MAELASLVQRLEVAVGRLESMSGSGGSTGDCAGGDVPMHVAEFDAIVSGAVACYVSISEKIGGDVKKHADMVKQAFSYQREFLNKASISQKPSESVLQTLLKPVSAEVRKVGEFREGNRSSPFFNHLSAVSESIPALGWVAVAPKPGPHVKEMQDAAMFYTNRVLKEYKEKDKTHVDWVKAYISIWTDLQNYIKKNHTTGLNWSKSGPVATASAAPPSAPGGCPAPPPPGPPPPPPPCMDISSSSGPGGDSSADRLALFASLNKGSDITKGLKHVSDNQKTHKNPALRGGSGPVCRGPKPYTASSPRPAACATPTRTERSVLELEGKKWKVEHQEGAQDLVISDTELKQVVYAFKCNNSTLQVKGKINSITIDNCKKMGLVFDDVVGIVEIINSKDVKIQVIGKVPTISINKTDGCHIYLSKDSLNCEIVSAKSSEMNILVPKDDGEFVEVPVPEQFKTIWDGNRLVTTASEITG